jgi:hypothetical protein
VSDVVESVLCGVLGLASIGCFFVIVENLAALP